MPAGAAVRFEVSATVRADFDGHSNLQASLSDLQEDLRPENNSIAVAFNVVPDAQASDFNLDGKVSFVYFIVLANGFGKTSNAMRMNGDANRDGAVDFLDFIVLSQEYGGPDR